MTAATSQASRTRPGTVTSVDPQPFLTWLADLIRAQQRVEIADVRVTDTWCVVVRFGDGAGAFIKVCHVAPADAATPERPTWPGPNAMPPKSPPPPAAAKTSPRVSYFVGWLRHQMETADKCPPMQSFEEVGAVGEHWPRFGFKVIVRDQALFLSIVGVAPDDGFDLTLPEFFDPSEEEDGRYRRTREVPGVRGDHLSEPRRADTAASR
jgi:hypothetical protein